MAGDPCRARSDAVSNLVRHGMFVIALVLAGLATWRVIVTGLADRLINGAPEQALLWEPHNPSALLAVAKRQLDDDNPDPAAATARELLRVEPLTGEGFVILAKVAEKAGDLAHAETLYGIAVRRAPRNVYARAWIVENLLRKNRYRDALDQFDTLFRIAAEQARKFLPHFTQLADTPEFTHALAAAFESHVPWKADMLLALLEHGSRDAVDNIFGALQLKGDLASDETGRWLDRLMRDGLWGEAYSRWVGGLTLTPGAPLPLLYNGGFETEPTSIGFDWRVRPTVGVTIEREPVAGATGSFAIDIGFAGRRVPEVNLEQRLFLAPGAYRFSFRAHAEALNSDKGLQWALQCFGQNQPLAASALLEGSFAWKRFETAFVVPDDNCPSQRIWLRNPGAAAAGKEVGGEIWFDDFAVSRDRNAH